MKVKTFILSLLLTMFCSTSFGQHWGEIPNHYEGNMTFVTQIFIDGVLQSEDIEIGAFCGDEFRGSARPIASQANLVFLLIEGDGDHNGDQISFRLAEHNADGTSVELGNVIFNALTYEHNASIGGSPADLVNDLLPEDDRTEFNSVARLNGNVYPSLANALAACTTGNNTIELLKDNAEDVTIKQVEGVNITIDGGTSRFDYSGTITIHGNARYQGAETLTFTNIDFTTDKAGHYFIDSNSTGSVERYAHNVTVDDCNFTATGPGINSAVAMRIRQGYNIAINGGEFAGLHSVLQAYGNAGINITGIESNCKNGISVGSSTNVVITGSDITATGDTGYGVRAGENVTGPLTITGTEINAFIPVSVRKVTDDTNCEFTFTGNTMTASNTDGYWCVIGTSEYEANGSLPETAGKIIVDATEADLLGVYGYSRVEVKFADSTTKYFYKMEDAVPYNNADNYEGATIKLLSNCAGRGLRFWENDMTFDLNGKNYTITQAVGSSGTESQGFQIRPEVTGNVTIKNGTIDIKAGTNVKWMFNSYAADFVVKDVTIDGTNMVTNTSEDYLLVVQNAGDQATFDNVTIQNYDAKKVYLEGNTTFVAPQEFDNIEIPAGYVLVYENGAYIVKAGNVLNVNTGEKYDKISSAITAATAGDTLQLLQDITEDVTITKNIKLDGAGKNYTGKITLNKVNFTAENVNFVKGNIYKNKNTGVGGTYTIKNCTFDGQNMNDYAVNLGGTSAIVIEGVTAKDYGYGFLQVPASNTSVSVKDVEISNVNYGLKIDYSGGVTLENVKAVASVAGVLNSNFGAKTITIKNSELSILGTWERGTNLTTTYLFEGNNTIGQFVTEDALDIFKLTKTDATLTAPEGLNVTTSVAGYVVVYENGAYIVKAGNVLNANTGAKYATLAEAITPATAGDTLVLLANITEDVTVNKSVTIDGKAADAEANSEYTGNIKISGNVNVTINEVAFVNGYVDHTSSNSTGTITVKYCSFANGGYAITTSRIKSVTIENCEVTNQSLLYAKLSTSDIVVKNVNISKGNYVAHIVYGSTAYFENVNATEMTGYGIQTQNYGAKTITINNCKFETPNYNSISVRDDRTEAIDTFIFKGTNEMTSLRDTDKANYVLAEVDATLTAPEGYTVTTSVENSLVKYVDGAYKVVPAVAKIGDVCYETLADAVEAATAGQTVELIADAIGAGLKINKDVTINFGGKTYTINQAVGSTGTESQGFQLLMNNTVTLKNGTIAIAEGTNVKWMFNAYADVTLEDLNVNCANMAAPAENEANYVLVVNNGGSATPTVNYSGVNVTNFPSTNQIWLDPTTTLKAGAGLESSIETEEGYVVVYNNGEYTAIAGNVLNANTGAKYAKIVDAVTAATAGDTLVLLADITENVTVNKNLTIDGKAEGATANSKYTGKMTVNSSLNINIRNIDFVKGYIDELGGAHGYFTIVDCNFDGVDKSIGYAVTVRGGDKLTIENSTAKNYSYGMLYIPSAVANIAIKDVEVSNVTAAFNISYSGDGTFENVEVDNVTYGLHVQNYGARTFTLKDCVMNNVDYPTYIQQKSTAKVTFEFNNVLGYKEAINSGSNQAKYGKYVLTSTAAKLTNVADDFNVTVSEDLADNGYVVEYNVENGVGTYSVVAGNIALERNGEIVKKFATIQDAINAAVDNDKVVVLADIEVNINDVEGLPTVGGYPTYYEVTGKTISIDLNGMTIKANVTTPTMLLGLFSTEQNGNLTFIDSSNGSGTVEVVASDDANVYSLITNYEETSSITINNGNYRLNKTGKDGQSLIYDSPGNMVINGGNFHLGNIGTDGVNNGLPWIFNCYGKDQGNVTVNGGTFNADVNHQHWAHEVYVPNTLALKDNGNGTWTVVPAVAQGTDSWRGYGRSLGYASIADAAHWAKAETTVTVVADHETTVPAVVERNLTLDMNAKAVIAQDIYPVIRIQNDANVTVKNGNITNNDYVFVLGASDGSSAGNLTIESGVYTGTTTVASVTKGLLTINGGEFKVNYSEYGATYMINCIDANYNDDSANVEIYGGKFYGFNPENNAAEGANTNFCAQGYGAIENTPNVWTVVPKQTAEVKGGWNWFSYYVEGDVLDQLQNSLGTVGVQIKSRTQFTQYSNDGSWNGDLVSTTPAESYKINVDADAVINVTGNIVDPSTCYIMLNNGGNNVGAWNWIGYPLAQETSVTTAFAGVVKNGDEVKTRTGFAKYVNGQWWGPLMTLEPGVGYMYFRAGANETVSDFTYPTPSSKEAVQPNITADANLWVPNSTSYANNMTMVAVLNMNGEMMNDNYEVAAMVNGEVRGSARPIYVEPMDAYMLFLTIHGEGVEEVTFQCYDFNTDTEYVLNNTINYSDDARLGSVNEPYVLCYGTMGIGENAMNTINIYPNPTTTGREINLGATCDKVEVYNALGVKVAEYQNVDTLDAIETAGIYVIRVTNDGDVKHCRLVVK